MDLTPDRGHSHKDTSSLQGLLVGSGHLPHSHFPLVFLVSTGGSLMLYLVSFWIPLQPHNQRQFPLSWNPHQIVTVPKMSRPFPPGIRAPQFSHIAALCSDGTQCHPGTLCGDNTRWCLGSKVWFVPLRSHLFLI